MATATDPRGPRPRTLTAADVMTPSPRTCSPFSTVVEAVMIFRDADCGAVPVVDAGAPVGILTDRDVALALADFPDLASRPVSDVMTRGAVSVLPDTPLDQVKDALSAHSVRRLLVADRSGQLLGVVAFRDLAPYLPDQDVGAVVTDIVEHP
jgi:CBS domain-containing protein